MLQNTSKTLGFQKIMVYKTPPGGGGVGGGGKPYLARGLIVLASIFLPNQELDRLYSRLTILNTCVGLKAKVNRLGDLSLPRKSVVRLTDRPNMTLDVYRGRKTTIQQQ